MRFRCSHCSRVLDTPDDQAGRRCRCTNCHAVLRIPVPAPSDGETAGMHGPDGIPLVEAFGNGGPDTTGIEWLDTFPFEEDLLGREI